MTGGSRSLARWIGAWLLKRIDARWAAMSEALCADSALCSLPDALDCWFAVSAASFKKPHRVIGKHCVNFGLTTLH